MKLVHYKTDGSIEAQDLPVRIVLKFLTAPVDGALAVATQKDVRYSPGNLLRDLPQRHHFARPCGTFDLQITSVVVVVPLQRCDHLEIQRHPDGPASI